MAAVPALVNRLYAVVEELEQLFPGRHFTPDGHLVGSLGEVWAAHLYGIELARASEPDHDGTVGGRQVQIKATQGQSVGLRAQPDYLLVLQLRRGGEPLEVYNGPGAAAWARAGRPQKNGQRQIRLSTLRELAAAVPPGERIPRR